MNYIIFVLELSTATNVPFVIRKEKIGLRGIFVTLGILWSVLYCSGNQNFMRTMGHPSLRYAYLFRLVLRPRSLALVYGVNSPPPASGLSLLTVYFPKLQ